MKRLNRLLLCGALLGLCFPMGCFAQGLDPKRNPLLALQVAKADQGVVEFYGKAVDQFGKPVPGAAVHINIIEAHILYTGYRPIAIDLVTDAHGCFQIEPSRGIRASDLHVKVIAKEGYEAIRQKWPDQSQFVYYKGAATAFKPDRNKPELFLLRKKLLEPTFLLQGNASIDPQIQVSESGNIVRCDIIRGGLAENERDLVVNGKPLTIDFQVRATFNPANTTWSVVISPGTPGGGIIASEQKLYEAPPEGYQAQYAFVAEEGKEPPKKYLYLRSRQPAIYTRIELSDPNANEEFFRLNIREMLTNPYGERNLEPMAGTSIYSNEDNRYDRHYRELLRKLEDGADEAFRHNRRPIKPDLSRLISEAREKDRTEKGK